LRDIDLIGADEPFERLLTQGMVTKETHHCPNHGYLFPTEITEQHTCKKCGMLATIGRIEKMSKSKKNVIEPDEIVERYGADTARLFILFASPPEKDLEWSDSGVEGASRFLNRVYRLFDAAKDLFSGKLQDLEAYEKKVIETTDHKGLEKEILFFTHKTIKKVTEDIEVRFHLNTAVASLMELVNYFQSLQTEAIKKDKNALLAYLHGLKMMTILLSPFVPHITEDIWHSIGYQSFLFHEPWPDYNEELALQDMVTIVLQVNGKLRDRIEAPRDSDEEELKVMAFRSEKIKKYTQGKTIAKVIAVPNKLLNIVVK